jgi:5'(3')-deoxyribonucleotidase
MSKILIDMDAIISNLSKKVLDRYNEEHITQFDIEHLSDYHFEKVLPQGAKADAYLKEPGFYSDLEVIPGALDALTFLNERHEIVIVSSPGHNWNCIPEKAQWLDTRFPFLNPRNRIFTPEKHHTFGDYLIDDAPRNLLAWQNEYPCKTTIAIAYPYNRSVQGRIDFRAEDYKDTAKAWNAIIAYIDLCESKGNRRENC